MNNCDVEHEICPYDKSHMILKARMLTHLARCAKNYPNSEMLVCVFNKKHVIPEPEMKISTSSIQGYLRPQYVPSLRRSWKDTTIHTSKQLYHYRSCPDRFKADQFNMKVGDIECPVKTEVPIAIDMPQSDENWDDDVSGGSVLDRIKDIEDKDVIVTMNAVGKSKTKRKELRKMECLRHQMLLDSAKQHHQPALNKVTQEKRVLDMKPIRAPTVVDNTSTQLQMRLKKNEEAAKAINETDKKIEAQLDSRHDNKAAMNELSELFKHKVKRSSKSSDISESSVSSRITESSAKSYASLLAERQQASLKNQSAKGQKQPFNNHDINKTSKIGSNGMQVLQSSIFEGGPRGRGRPVVNPYHPEVAGRSATNSTHSDVGRSVTNPSPTISVLSQASGSSVRSPINDVNLLTDEHGFLHMPVPGKGRGKSFLHN